jgi:hypothetical protein
MLTFSRDIFTVVWAVKTNVPVNTEDIESNIREQPTGSPE